MDTTSISTNENNKELSNLEMGEIIQNNDIISSENDNESGSESTEDEIRELNNYYEKKDLQTINEMREKLSQEYKEIGITRHRNARATFRKENSQPGSSSKIGFQNSTMSFFNKKSRRYSSLKYSNQIKSKWFNNMQINRITFWDKLWFYINSLYNNRIYKFKFVQYMGELTMMYEDSTKLLSEFKKIEKDAMMNINNNKNNSPLYFLYEAEDDINNTFLRIDVFLRRHIQFMKLCNSPVDLFLDNYYSARNNSCGLIEIANDEIKTCYSKAEKQFDKSFFIHYNDCKDLELKHDFLIEMEGSFFEGSDRIYSTNRRIAALHNILGELHAISQFIKTTVDMNDQLLFRVLMLFGSFLMLLGEFVWNTQLKHYYYN